MCERLRRERVHLAEIEDVDDPEGRSGVHAYMRAMKHGRPVPPVFLMRMDGELHLIHGVDQVAAAEEMGLSKIGAVVFEPLSVQEENEVGCIGYDLGVAGDNIWRGLRRWMGQEAETGAGEPTGSSCTVALLPGMSAASKACVAAEARAAGIAVEGG